MSDRYGSNAADEILDAMTQGRVIELDVRLSVAAATLAHSEKLAMADAIILAAANQHNATIWTQDADLRRFPNVKFKEKRK